MVLNEKNFKEIIASYKKEDWKPLLELIHEIEKTSKFGEIRRREKDEKGVIQMPFIIEEEIVYKFINVVYDIPIIISFDWGAWDEGRKFVNDKSFDFNSIDIPTKCKLITAIVRNDRFCEGCLVAAFEEGLILKILKSIEYQLK